MLSNWPNSASRLLLDSVVVYFVDMIKSALRTTKLVATSAVARRGFRSRAGLVRRDASKSKSVAGQRGSSSRTRN
jgi:hypothetical protein